MTDNLKIQTARDKVKCDHGEVCRPSSGCPHRRVHPALGSCLKTGCGQNDDSKCVLIDQPQTARDKICEVLQHVSDNPAAWGDGVVEEIYKAVSLEIKDKLTDDFTAVLGALRSLQAALVNPMPDFAILPEITYRTEYVGGHGNLTTVLCNGEEIGELRGSGFYCRKCSALML